MNHRVPHRRLLTLLCLLALLAAQVFGVARGYLCDCAGLPEWTAQDYCVGPHGADCHGGVADAAGEADSESRKDHEPVRDEVQLRLVQSLEAPALVPVLMAFVSAQADEAGSELQRRARVSCEVAGGPPPGVVVARTVVFLI